MLGPNRRFARGFNRDAHEHSTVEARMADGSRLIARPRIAQRRYDVQSIPGLPGRSQPSPEYDLLRKAERARIVAASAQSNASDGWQPRWLWPVIGRMSGVYGYTRSLWGVPR